MAGPVGSMSAEEIRKENIVDITKVDVNKRMGYNKRVEKYGADCASKGKGFCSACAMREHEEKREEWKHRQQAERRAGKELNQVFDPHIDLDRFADRMKKVGEETKYYTSKLQPTPQPVVFEDWKCDVCGGMHSIQREAIKEASRKK